MRGYPAAGQRHMRVSVRIPRDDVRIGFLHITEIFRHIFPAMYAVFKAGFLRPVKTIDKAVIGPLCIVVLGHQINVTVVFAQIPMFGGYAGPRRRRVGLQHFLGKLQESAVLGVWPSIQPVGSGSHQINGAVHTGQGTVVVGKLVRPSDIVDLQLRVYLFRQDRIQLLQHGVNGGRLITGGRITRGHIGDHHVLRGIHISPASPWIVRIHCRRFRSFSSLRGSCRVIGRCCALLRCCAFLRRSGAAL